MAVEAAGLGYVDALLIRGAYQVKKALPFIVGGEVVGRISATGPGVDASRIGQRISAYATEGALAGHVRLPLSAVFPIPEDLPAAHAIELLGSVCTALHAFDCGALKPGETVLVLGAGGSVGAAALAVATALGAHAIGAASSQAKRDHALSRGAVATVDYSQSGWRSELKATGFPTVDLVFDPVGGAFSETAFRTLAPGGRHLVVGFASGDIPRLPLNLPLLKRASVIGVALGAYFEAEPGAAAALYARAVNLWREGLLPAAEEVAVHPLEAAPQLLQAMLGREHVGKAVIAF